MLVKGLILFCVLIATIVLAYGQHNRMNKRRKNRKRYWDR